MARAIISIVFVFIALSYGCSGGGSSVDPLSGTWYVAAGDIFDDTCHYSDPPREFSGNYTLTNHGNGTMTIQPGTSAAPFSCTLQGADFTCPSRADEDIVVTANATVKVDVSVVGSFSSSTQGSGHETADIDCEGTDCGTVAALAGVTFPCSYSQYFTTQFSAP